MQFVRACHRHAGHSGRGAKASQPTKTRHPSSCKPLNQVVEAINNRNVILCTAGMLFGVPGRSRAGGHGSRCAVGHPVMVNVRDPHTVDCRGGNLHRTREAPLPAGTISIFLPVAFLTGDRVALPQERDVKMATAPGEPALLANVATDNRLVAFSPYRDPKDINKRFGHIRMGISTRDGRASAGVAAMSAAGASAPIIKYRM